MSIWQIIKKIFNLISCIINYISGKKKEEYIQKEETFNKTSNDLRDSYADIDKENNQKKTDDLKNRLDNMF